MCFYIPEKRTREPLITKKDIPVYKRVDPISNTRANPGVFNDPNFEYTIGQVTAFIKLVPYRTYHSFLVKKASRIDEGYHSWQYRKRRVGDSSEANALFTIPKGTPYYKYAGSYVSAQIRFDKYIEPLSGIKDTFYDIFLRMVGMF